MFLVFLMVRRKHDDDGVWVIDDGQRVFDAQQINREGATQQSILQRWVSLLENPRSLTSSSYESSVAPDANADRRFGEHDAKKRPLAPR